MEFDFQLLRLNNQWFIQFLFYDLALLCFPFLFCGIDRSIVRLQLFVRGGQFGELRWIAGRSSRKLDRLFLRFVEERKQSIIIGVWNRIVFVCVALGTTHGESQPNRSDRIGSIECRSDPKFLLVGTTFGVGEGLAIEGGGNALIGSRVGKLITRQLLDRELIERHIAIECLNHPVAVNVCIGAIAIFFISIAIGVACQVQPMPSPAFAKVLGAQQPVDHFLNGGICIQCVIGSKGFHFAMRWQ